MVPISTTDSLIVIAGWIILGYSALLFIFFSVQLIFQLLRRFYEVIARKPDRSEITAISDLSINKTGTAKYLILLIAGALFFGSWFLPEEDPEPMAEEDLQYQLDLGGTDISLFQCYKCDKISANCLCHSSYGYPEDLCCECARESYKICFICDKATSDYYLWQDEEGNSDELYYCGNCGDEYADTGKMICIDGKGYYLETVSPYSYD